MLYLNSGLPGAGKTLYTVTTVPQEFPGRVVYYSGIKELKLPWIKLEMPAVPCGPECKGACQWPTVPDGAVVVLDEFQGCARVRGAGKEVPKHIQQLETHRHRGIDLVVISQHPNLLDTNVRRLIGRHTHVRRTWGMGTAKLFQWDRVGDPDSNSDMAEANQVRFQYPKTSFALYHSAEVHTHKVRLPKRVGFAALLLCTLVGLVFYTYSWMHKKTEPTAVAGALPGLSSGSQSSDNKRKAPTTYAEWAEERRPVAPEDAASSVRYYALTQPVRAPRIAACVRSADRCQCFTQQATIVKVSELQCAEFLANLHFQDWGPGGESGLTNESQGRGDGRERTERQPGVSASYHPLVGGTQVPPTPK